MRGFNVELRRHELYKVVKPSRYFKIYYSTKNISVYVEGIVETCEMENFEMLTKGQISIVCPDIYWYSTETQIAEYSRITGAFHFIFPDNDETFPIGKYNTQNIMTIVNDGDEVCFTLEISESPAKNPTIYNVVTDEYMQILSEIKDRIIYPTVNYTKRISYSDIIKSVFIFSDNGITKYTSAKYQTDSSA